MTDALRIVVGKQYADAGDYVGTRVTLHDSLGVPVASVDVDMIEKIERVVVPDAGGTPPTFDNSRQTEPDLAGDATTPAADPSQPTAPPVQ